ncbi:O-antigen translocase [Saccharospirillum alexandrii]|uniref:O-antigen translocase n=1 Tax=Saccharospirillum alexandrii TaxID=2448477 RepID=UPI001FE65F2D|nr:O-antigen translocase [Saccharospirillum alexandrii]
MTLQAFEMTLIKTSLLNGIAVVIKMLTLLGINKILAIYVGPSGYAALGQFQNAVQMITTFASGALNTGVTKYTAEYFDDEARQHTVWRTAGTIAMIGTFITAVLVSILNETLAGWFLQDESLGSVFVWFSGTLVFFVFNTLLMAVLNGKKEIKLYVSANIAGSIFSLSVTSVLAISYGLYGALVALAIYQSLTFFVTLVLVYKAPWFKLSYLLGRVDRIAAKNLAKYTAMALTSAVCVPISHILVRNHIGESFGWSAAGYWEAMWRLSTAYLILITTTLSVYYLPRLSELIDPSDIKREILQGYKIILPTVSVLGLMIYLLRYDIIRILFSSEFLPMASLFPMQMLGDTLKIGSWVLSYLMLSKAMMKMFILSEIIFAGMFYVFTVIFTNFVGLDGVAIAHAVNYFCYWVVVSTIILKYYRNNSEI